MEIPQLPLRNIFLGLLQNTSNSNGYIIEALSEDHKIIVAKAECFVYYSFEATKDQIMVLDIQGGGYNLYDPEVASTALLDKDQEQLQFCTGNLSKALFIWGGLAHLSRLAHLGGIFLSFRSYDTFYPT